MKTIAKLPRSFNALYKNDFDRILSDEIATLGNDYLPLQQALSSSSIALDDNINVVILSITELDKHMRIKASLFYDGIIAGCNCSDDPSPIERQAEHCTVEILLDRQSPDASIELTDE